MLYCILQAKEGSEYTLKIMSNYVLRNGYQRKNCYCFKATKQAKKLRCLPSHFPQVMYNHFSTEIGPVKGNKVDSYPFLLWHRGPHPIS